MAQLQLGPQCCCDCPTKESVGLPDVITGAFTLLSSGSTGMPSDSKVDTCTGGDVYVRFQENPFFAELLGSITFDYEMPTPTGCNTSCCFRYVGRQDDTFTEAPCGSPAIPTFLLADSPFTPTGSWDGIYWSASGQPINEGDCENRDGPGCTDAAPYCVGEEPECNDPPCGAGEGTDCPDCAECAQANQENWLGTLYTTTPILGSAQLLICVSGNVVTICGNVTLSYFVVELTGSYNYVAAHLPSAPESCQADESLTDETTKECGTAVGIEFEFSMSADLTAVSGTTLWDKIQNATWTFEYEYVACGPPASCSGDQVICTGDCGWLCNGFCIETCSDQGGSPGVLSTNDPVDQICYYSVGELQVDFA